MVRFFVKALMRKMDQDSTEITFSETGEMELVVNKLYGIIGAISTIIGLVIVGAMLINGSTSLRIDIIMLAIFLGLGLLLVFYFLNTKVYITEDEIVYTGMTKRQKKVKWSDISKVTFDRNSKELSLIAGKSKIKVHMHMIGFNSFLAVLKSKLDTSVYAESIGE